MRLLPTTTIGAALRPGSIEAPAKLARWGARALAVAALSASVAACAPRDRTPRDFCTPLGRTLSQRERSIDALKGLLGDRARIERLLGKAPVHFFSFVDEREAADPAMTKAQIAAAYYSKFPDCCYVRPPAYMSQPDLRRLYGDEIKRWDAQVYIERMLPADRRSHQQRFTRAVSACDDVIQYAGGDDAILE